MSLVWLQKAIGALISLSCYHARSRSHAQLLIDAMEVLPPLDQAGIFSPRGDRYDPQVDSECQRERERERERVCVCVCVRDGDREQKTSVYRALAMPSMLTVR
jgi:hypothetical protein